MERGDANAYKQSKFDRKFLPCPCNITRNINRLSPLSNVVKGLWGFFVLRGDQVDPHVGGIEQNDEGAENAK